MNEGRSKLRRGSGQLVLVRLVPLAGGAGGDAVGAVRAVERRRAVEHARSSIPRGARILVRVVVVAGLIVGLHARVADIERAAAGRRGADRGAGADGIRRGAYRLAGGRREGGRGVGHRRNGKRAGGLRVVEGGHLVDEAAAAGAAVAVGPGGADVIAPDRGGAGGRRGRRIGADHVRLRYAVQYPACRIGSHSESPAAGADRARRVRLGRVVAVFLTGAAVEISALAFDIDRLPARPRAGGDVQDRAGAVAAARVDKRREEVGVRIQSARRRRQIGRRARAGSKRLAHAIDRAGRGPAGVARGPGHRIAHGI